MQFLYLAATNGMERSVLLMTHFASKVQSFNLEYYSFIPGDSFIVIKRDKIDLMVKHSTIERSLFACATASELLCDGWSEGKQKQTDTDN